jgi:DNA topoisomerase III
VTGFRGRSGRSFSAKLKLAQADEGKWRLEFDEEWATNQPAAAVEAQTPAETTAA